MPPSLHMSRRWILTISYLRGNHVLRIYLRPTSCCHLLRTQGFFCVDCPKLFPLAPRPKPSPAPGTKRRASGTLTAKAVLSQRRANMKRNAEAAKQRREGAAQKRARGEKARWSYRGSAADNHVKRQLGTQNIGTAFDGSHGVDSQDIINIPECVQLTRIFGFDCTDRILCFQHWI